ncbi:hypothetical protein SERLA73DRAFT_73341 [Serpula lacrymans var. lacrymans S7.3]|uniref:Uncharacterized protein n=1 Tax=Serpula lacrymans var. lacrymans (strain S7.3) TaxID=936435 RepID=F8PXX5_SERL3|nr:hypothetical protein SERLA73DRAFT_73341 [Serpula lacrymans var. lacrymans S7.3]
MDANLSDEVDHYLEHRTRRIPQQVDKQNSGPSRVSDEAPPDEAPPEAPPPAEGPPTIGLTEQDLEQMANLARLEDLKTTMEFINTIHSALLDDHYHQNHSGLVERLRNPSQEIFAINNPFIHYSLNLFLATNNTSKDTYNKARESYYRLHPENQGKILLLYQIKHFVAEESGVDGIIHNMCVNSYLAFTGPFAALEVCPKCQEQP